MCHDSGVGDRVDSLERQGWLIRVVLIAAAAALVVDSTGTAFSYVSGVPGDQGIYIGAVRHWLAGGDLYSWNVDGYGFTYPPFAALLFLPMAIAPEGVAVAVLAGLSWLSAAAIAWMLASSFVGGRRWATVALALLILGAILRTPPFLVNFKGGQVNIILTLLCLAGGLPAARQLRGWPVGLAAAWKVTPALFGVFELANRQFRELLWTVSGFLAATLVAFVVAPADSIGYWTHHLWQTGRVGDPTFLGNHSLLGVVVRAGAPTSLLVVVAFGALVFGIWASVVAWHQGEHLFALTVVGCVTVLVSPISWAHHETFTILGGVLMIAHPRRWVGALGLTVVLTYWQWGRLNVWLAPEVANLLPTVFAVVVVSCGFVLRGGSRCDEADRSLIVRSA